MPTNSGQTKRVKARLSKGKGKSPLGKLVGWTLYSFFCVVVLFGGILFGWLHSSSVLRHIGLINLIHPPKPANLFQKNSLTVLVLGCDVDKSVGGAKITKNGARSDSMLLLKFDFPDNKITGFSIPRDTLLKIPGMPVHKMNAFHEFGGDALAQKAVETLLPGVQIDRTVSINFDGFVNMVNAVGGVPYFVPKNMNWDDNAGDLHIHFKKGMQVLDGLQAEELVRFRHTDSDILRQERQHDFMIAFQSELKSKPQALTSVLDQTAAMLGDGFSDLETVSIGAWAYRVPKNNIELGMLPTVNGSHSTLHVVKQDIPKVLVKYGFLPHDSSSEAVS